ncbi:CC_3452 family protein [Sphingomonas mesophila]|uniref:CC_3452 family protein n=1 Tax=Sphingomonas mesophila TaxID=2303576 RepID=UPI0013C37894|nr:hypothetical protein [Sphingomonas mesophila]
MTRFASIALVAALVAAPATAGTYAAKPVAGGQPAKVVTRDVAWNFAGGAFVGRTDQSRPVVLCQALAKKVGPIASFTADGRPLSAAELAKCNGKAGGGQAVANAN